MGEPALPHGALPVRAGARLLPRSATRSPSGCAFPERSLIVAVPVRLDDGRRVVFPGYRVQHSSVLGPTKGGIRYDHARLARRVRGAGDVDDVEVRAPAAALRRREGRHALRPARALAAGAPGGHPPLHRRAAARSSARRRTLPAPDMATDEQTMAWMMDTYSMQVGYAVPEIVTGKPISIGGSVFRPEATGAGVVMVDRARVPATRLGPRRAALRRPGLRQGRRRRGLRAGTSAARR